MSYHASTPALRERRGREGSHNKMKGELYNVHKRNTQLGVARIQLACVCTSNNNKALGLKILTMVTGTENLNRSMADVF